MVILRALLLMVLSLGLTVALQDAVRRRLPEARRSRGWNGATWGAAVYAFGPLSLFGFFWVTRTPGRWGAVIALASGLTGAVLCFAALAAVDTGLEALLGPWR